VGRHGGNNFPTTISTLRDGVPVLKKLNWTPDWPFPPPDEIRFPAFSSIFTGLIPSLPSYPVTVSLTPIEARGSVSILQTPTEANGYTLIVDFNDDPLGGPAFYTVQLTVSGPLAYLLRTVGSTSRTQTMKLTNVGSDPLEITGITLAGTNTGDFVQQNDCGASLAARANCSIGVTFTPTAEGVRTASVSIADSAPDSPQTVALWGKGTFFGRLPWSMNFGDQPVGTTSAAQTTIVTNAGLTPMAIYSIGIGGANPGDFSQTNTCGASLNPGATCTVSVTFTPSARGLRSALIVVHDSASDGPHKVSLAGSGT